MLTVIISHCWEIQRKSVYVAGLLAFFKLSVEVNFEIISNHGFRGFNFMNLIN